MSSKVLAHIPELMIFVSKTYQQITNPPICGREKAARIPSFNRSLLKWEKSLKNTNQFNWFSRTFIQYMYMMIHSLYCGLNTLTWYTFRQHYRLTKIGFSLWAFLFFTEIPRFLKKGDRDNIPFSSQSRDICLRTKVKRKPGELPVHVSRF